VGPPSAPYNLGGVLADSTDTHIRAGDARVGGN